MQQQKYANTAQPGKMKQSGSSYNNKQELKKKTHNQETFRLTISRWIIRKPDTLCYYSDTMPFIKMEVNYVDHRDFFVIRTELHP